MDAGLIADIFDGIADTFNISELFDDEDTVKKILYSIQITINVFFIIMMLIHAIKGEHSYEKNIYPKLAFSFIHFGISVYFLVRLFYKEKD
jgi:hypothetical protein